MKTKKLSPISLGATGAYKRRNLFGIQFFPFPENRLAPFRGNEQNVN